MSTDKENKPFDFGRKAQYFTLDIISDVAYREPFGFMETDSDLYDYTKIVESVFVAAAMVTIFPWINWILNLSIMKAVLPSDEDLLGIGKIQGYAISLFASLPTHLFPALPKKSWLSDLVQTRKLNETC